MIDKYFSAFESAVSPSNIILAIIGTMITSIIMGITYSNIRRSLKEGFLSFAIFQLIFIVMYFIVRSNVADYRLKQIKETMLDITFNCPQDFKNLEIDSWSTGLAAIQICPTEIGYYLTTTDYLEEEKDYESAALLIEMGLDFIKKSPIPYPLCKKLIFYYKHLKYHSEISNDCKGVIII